MGRIARVQAGSLPHNLMAYLGLLWLRDFGCSGISKRITWSYDTMQELKSDNKLDIVETLSVIGSIGGAIASVISQQIVFASIAIPLSLSVTLNLLNRRRLLDASSQSNQTAIAQIVRENFKTQEQVGTQASQLTQLQQLTTRKNGEQNKVETLTQQLAELGQSQNNYNLAIAQVRQENVETQAKFETLTQQLAELQQLTTNNFLVESQSNKNLNEYTQTLLNEQAKLAKTVDCLREIETCSQTIRLNPNHATAYYNRGLSYERLEDQEAAIGDYSEAIRLNPSYVEAYHSRGLIRAALGNKKGAVNDLRTAAKLFFEQGDIANYQIAKDFGKQLYQIDLQPQTEVFFEVAVERLFA